MINKLLIKWSCSKGHWKPKTIQPEHLSRNTLRVVCCGLKCCAVRLLNSELKPAWSRCPGVRLFHSQSLYCCGFCFRLLLLTINLISIQLFSFVNAHIVLVNSFIYSSFISILNSVRLLIISLAGHRSMIFPSLYPFQKCQNFKNLD